MLDSAQFCYYENKVFINTCFLLLSSLVKERKYAINILIHLKKSFDFISPGLPFHAMRDHMGHADPILAGMWGAR